MDGREAMTFSGSGVASYYLSNRGELSVSGGSGTSPAGAGAVHSNGAPTSHVLKAHSNPNAYCQPANVVAGNGGGGEVASAFQVEHSPHIYHHGMSEGVASPVTPGDSAKKKRGRPRKYAPDQTNVSLALSPLSATPSSGVLTSSESKRPRGRPPGSGWKQQLAPLGEWMNSSAGLAFTPHVIHVGSAEDVAAKILTFAQQRSRALCILSATGSVSAVTLQQHVSPGGDVTYEGCFDILCLSGSYLLDEAGGPLDRIGGISISVCSPDGRVVGGAVGGRLIAATKVQVVACSFVYGDKPNNKSEASEKEEKNPAQPAETSSTPVTTAPNQDQSINSTNGV